MSDWIKILMGGAATSVLAFATHALTGESYAAGLDDKATAALAASGAAGASVHIAREPSIRRLAILSGDLDDAARSEAKETVSGVSGIAEARWDDEIGSLAKPGIDGLAEAGPSKCQAEVTKAAEADPITFRSGSPYLSPASLRTIDAVAAALKECGSAEVTVEAHTDATGSAAINNSMSQARADGIAAALVERGIAADQLSAKGFGSEKPKVEGTGTAANQANRRIEFTVSGDASDAADAKPEEGE
ncbi:OmpA family protein [Pontixanthobacter aestiaquae]|uniref:OmpA family protein n=1 Tax=Pontixanthobacter aestiaquae TaxID=1509367 RepID=A0A844Z5Y8_9SPHN|nr:OmpA family protein [Pontixanthobacter aestiaquae]MDN3646094.1 OmpA family protein [Pontixanthobacter aestiaquae]MXO82914.1 OmpA family protein [Pontixanthobacter aestiaquae]